MAARSVVHLGSQDPTCPSEMNERVADTKGKTVKVIAYQLRFLPNDFNYKIIFMRRHIAEVLASSGKFKFLRENSPLSEREKVLAFKTEHVCYEAWLMKQAHMPAQNRDGNVAFKVTYVDSNWSGVCSHKGYENNRADERIWRNKQIQSQ